MGDRPTIFFEIIERIGCTSEASPEKSAEEADLVVPSGPEAAAAGPELVQRPGCGGFGVGNFKALFEAVEKYESTLFESTSDINRAE